MVIRTKDPGRFPYVCGGKVQIAPHLGSSVHIGAPDGGKICRGNVQSSSALYQLEVASTLGPPEGSAECVKKKKPKIARPG